MGAHGTPTNLKAFDVNSVDGRMRARLIALAQRIRDEDAATKASPRGSPRARPLSARAALERSHGAPMASPRPVPQLSARPRQPERQAAPARPSSARNAPTGQVARRPGSPRAQSPRGAATPTARPWMPATKWHFPGGNDSSTWETTHDRDFVNFVGRHENLMDPDDWTPADIGVKTEDDRVREMMAMEPNEIRVMLRGRLQYSNVFFAKPVTDYYCQTESGKPSSTFHAAEPIPGLQGKAPWRRPVAHLPEAAPLGKSWAPPRRNTGRGLRC